MTKIIIAVSQRIASLRPVLSLSSTYKLSAGRSLPRGRHRQRGSNGLGSATSTQPGDVSGDAMSWSWSSANAFAHIAAAIKPAATGGGGGSPVTTSYTTTPWATA
jgi:hypothetical protein